MQSCVGRITVSCRYNTATPASIAFKWKGLDRVKTETKVNTEIYQAGKAIERQRMSAYQGVPRLESDCVLKTTRSVKGNALSDL